MKLLEYMQQNPPKTFRAGPVYVPAGDYLIFFKQDTPHISERLDDVVSLYLSCDTKELVGVKVKGVRHILETAGSFGVGVKDGNGVPLGFFFLMGVGVAPIKDDQLPKMKWYDLLRKWKDVTVPADQLQFASAQGE